jgi:hypothetical protein
MRLCTRCILPESFPGISFDEQGVCNYCSTWRPERAAAAAKSRYEEKFLALVDRYRQQEGYQVLMAYSGGKDSTYTLELLVNRYRLRVLALTLDNGFISPLAVDNMHRVTEALEVDHLVLRPSPVLLKRIFTTAAKCELYAPKAMERASTICTSCIGLVKAVVLRTALEKRIPLVGFGWSPGQAPLQASVMHTNPELARLNQHTVQGPLSTVVGAEALSPYFVTPEQFSAAEHFPWNVHPLAFLNYDEERIVARNQELGWQKPSDTDGNSTNCTLNAYANEVHLQRYGFNPYAWEIANMVRSGSMTRELGLEKFRAPENPELVRYAQERLGL